MKRGPVVNYDINAGADRDETQFSDFRNIGNIRQ